MKTCPKCGAQNPEEAKFCKKCGALFVPNQWEQKFHDLIQRRAALEHEMSVYEQFERDRNQLFSLVEKNNDYIHKRQTYIENIEHYKVSKAIFILISFLWPFIIPLMITMMSNISFQSIGIAFLFLIVIYVIAIVAYNRSYKRVDTFKIPEIIESFITQHLNHYRTSVNVLNNKKMSLKLLYEDSSQYATIFTKEVWKLETMSTRKVSQNIRNYINNLSLSIKDIDNNLQTIGNL